MISVAIIGSGNVATHLFSAFSKADNVRVVQVNSRTLANILDVDVTIIAVSDDAIAAVSEKINNSFVVHTSGSVAMDTLKNQTRKGVFYPLQTFSKHKDIDFSDIPFCLEAEKKSDLLALEQLAKSIGNKIFYINSEQRKALHVAAVFVNNFTNHLYSIGNDICTKHKVPFEVLHPLIKETALKIATLSPVEAQTGPAKRNDIETIKNHLEFLNTSEQKIYKTLTKSIQKTHGKKL